MFFKVKYFVLQSKSSAKIKNQKSRIFKTGDTTFYYNSIYSY